MRQIGTSMYKHRLEIWDTKKEPGSVEINKTAKNGNGKET